MAAAETIGDDRIRHEARLSGPFGNIVDQYLAPNPHGNGQGRATNVRWDYRDGLQRERGIVSCAVITPNLR
jgi:hypothetical protein